MHKHLLLAGFIGIMSLPVWGQAAKSKPKPAVKKSAATATAASTKTTLRFRTTWGIYLSDTLPRPEMLKLLDSALVVRDEKNNKYPVVSFDFTYEKKEPYLNDTTGKPGFYTEAIGESFKGSKLDTLWSNTIKRSLARGEVLYFNNILVNYTGNKLYRVPQVQFTVK